MARCLRRRARLGSQPPSRKGVSMRVFGLVLVAILASVPASAQVRHPMGTVDVTAGPVACDGQECYDITVSCPEVAAPARARLKVGGTAEKGTILFTTGADGTVLYEIWPESRRVLDDIRTAGFQSVQLQWIDSWVFALPRDEEGMDRRMCRPATVAQWVHDNLHAQSESTALCATGHSGGASQVSYMLSHYGLEDILSLVVPTGGPPQARIDLMCSADPATAAFAFPPGFFPAGEVGPCVRADAAFTEYLRLSSVASGDGDYVRPETLIWFVFEEMGGMEVAQGEFYHDLLVSEGSPLVRKDIVPGVTHGGATALNRSREGTNRVRDILINECRPHMP